MEDPMPPMRLMVRGLALHGCHGVYPEERRDGNEFRIDVEITADVTSAVRHDDIRETVDYAAVVRLVSDINQQHQFNLIESFADAIAEGLLNRFPRIDELLVRVEKVSPPDLEGAVCAVETKKTRRK